jgi:putative phosphoribosyl transferase
MKQIFQNRNSAGCQLTDSLSCYAGDQDTVVLALPRGGVPVAYEIAKALALPLDVMLVRKIGAPGQEELAIGAIASGGKTVLNKALVEVLSINDESITRVKKREQYELERREMMYRGTRPQADLRSKNVILVDDGLATGATMLAAIYAVKEQSPNKVIVAVPVVTKEAVSRLKPYVDDVVYLTCPEPFKAVGCWYKEFSQLTDIEVIDCLKKAWYKSQ